MSIEVLRQIAASPLPKSFSNGCDVDAVKILRQAGLVIALLDEPPGCGAKVVAITEKGNEELLRFHYPTGSSRQSAQGGQGGRWIAQGAERVRSVIHKASSAFGGRH